MHIRVKITRDGSNQVEVLELEKYLKGVLPSEIKAEPTRSMQLSTMRKNLLM